MYVPLTLFFIMENLIAYRVSVKSHVAEKDITIILGCATLGVEVLQRLMERGYAFRVQPLEVVGKRTACETARAENFLRQLFYDEAVN